MHGATSQARLRAERTLLIPTEGKATPVLPRGESEIAELLAIPLEDLTDLPYGVEKKSRMWMSRAKQHDRTAPVNRAASYGLKINGLTIAVRGSVVVQHQAHEF
jgi:hypothetical protein